MRLSLKSWLADLNWLTADRALAWRNVLLVLGWGAFLVLALLSRGNLDPFGRPLGTDFSCFYAASRLVLAGHAVAAYDLAAHKLAEAAIFALPTTYAAFFYPPPFLILCAPLALLPYGAALLTWLSATGAAYFAAARSWAAGKFSWPTVLAFPALMINAGHGQTAFLSGALIGAGALWLETRPLAAGVAFGLLIFKPQMGIILPIALVIAGRWKTLASAALSALAFAGVSLALFGVSAWKGFVTASHLARAALEQGLIGFGKMVSAFAAAKVLGAPVPLAYAVQIAVVIGLVAFLLRNGRRRDGAQPALLVLCCLLPSPYLFDYDLVALAFPLAWLAKEGLETGFRRWEKLALALGFILPLLGRPLATALHVPIAPAVLIGLLILVARRRPATSLAELRPVPSAI